MQYFTFTEGMIKYNDIRPLYAGTEQCKPLHHFGPVTHHHSVIHFCKSGKGVFSCDEGVFEIKPGQIFIKRPGQVYFQQADEFEPWHYVWIAFSGTVQDKTVSLPPVMDIEDGSVFDSIEKLLHGGVFNQEDYLICLIQLLRQLLPIGGERTPAFAIKARDYIDLHYMENLGVEHIADFLGVDRRYLLRVFKRRFGVTVVDYIIKVRMQAAEKFLKQGHKVAKVCVMCGYPDPYSFSKMFKKYYGVSPSYYLSKK